MSWTTPFIWMWKGDYLNLGAGAETGIYKGGELFWDVAVDDAMPMTLTLYDKNGDTIMCYMPDDSQWWITGFDPMIQDVDPDDLTVIGSVDMSSYPELFLKFIDKYGKGDYSEFCFDEKNQTVYYNWWGKDNEKIRDNIMVRCFMYEFRRM